MPNTRRPRSIRLPSDMVLTAQSIVAIAACFPAEELGELIERLIDRLDGLTPDADLGPEPEMGRA